MKKNLRLRATTAFTCIVAMVLSLFVSIGVRADSYDTITFSSDKITAGSTGTGYKISGTTLTIKSAGTYKITGSCSEGSIVVDKGVTDVTLILDSLTLSSSTTAPIVIKKGSTATIDLSGTSTLADKEDPSTEETNSDFEGAVIKVKTGSTLNLTGNGTLNIDASACKNGIKGGTEATVNISGGSYNVDAANTGIASDGKVNITGGTFYISTWNEGIKSAPDEDDTTSEGTVYISGGTFTLDVSGDAIHGQYGTTITGGSFSIDANDDAIHSDYTTTIGTDGSSEGPNIIINSSYEGIEGSIVNLYSGYAYINADDDGVNAANSDLTSYDYSINITGGTWYINSGGDGIDSNNNINISGGQTEVFGSTNGGNAALDYDNKAYLTGGTLLAVGNVGMGQTVSSGLSIVFNNVAIENGTPILIKNSAGETVYSATGIKSANQVIFASADLDPNDTYTLVLSNEEAQSTTTDEASQKAQTSGMGGGPGEGGRPNDGGIPGDMGRKGGKQSSGNSYSGEWLNGWWYNADGSWSYPYQGSWKQDTYGWWFEDESGWYPTNAWMKVDGYWYYFDSNGYMEASCYRDGYWLTSSGAMDSNYSGSWKSDSNGWWYSDSSGWYPWSQWLKINGAWYYFYSDGYMAVSTTIDGYRVGASGAWE